MKKEFCYIAMLKKIRLHRMFRIAPLLLSMLSDFATLLKMVRSYFIGSYTSVSRKTIFKITFAFAYVLFFLDLIPDFIPVVGWLDDMVVLTWLMNSLQGEIESYRKWEAGR